MGNDSQNCLITWRINRFDQQVFLVTSFSLIFHSFFVNPNETGETLKLSSMKKLQFGDSDQVLGMMF